MTVRARLALACITALALTACGTGASTHSSARPSGRSKGGSTIAAPLQASNPTLAGTTLEGAAFDFASIAGRPTVLWFWAPWCTICRAEGPGVARVAAKLGDSVTFIGIPGRGERPAMKQFVADTGVGGFQHVVDADGAIWNEFGVVSQPSFAFIDAAGHVKKVDGSLTEEQLEAAAGALG